MELADLQHNVPSSHSRTTSILKLSPEPQERVCIEPPKKGTNDELAVLMAEQRRQWPGDAS